ncbi:MAG: acyl carrier protein [Clostridiaceae bacterium]|nr:acyl carrier protein [Eubacteriales bacterium]
MVFQKTAEILASYKGIDAAGITPETGFTELELDSLDRVELIMSMEEAFNVQIDAATPIESVGELVALIEAQLNGGDAL